MKKSRKIFFAVVCIGLIIVCIIIWKRPKETFVAWDAPTSFTDGTPIPSDMPLQYNVYIDPDSDETHDDKILLTKVPISDTRYPIAAIKQKGTFFIGIQAVADRDETGHEYKKPKVSTIAWSCNESDTESGTFDVENK